MLKSIVPSFVRRVRLESNRGLAAEALKKTKLYDRHVELEAKMAPFAGYSMPIQYPDGIKESHLFVRASAGLFDVSHMGQIRCVERGRMRKRSLRHAGDTNILTGFVSRQNSPPFTLLVDCRTEHRVLLFFQILLEFVSLRLPVFLQPSRQGPRRIPGEACHGRCARSSGGSLCSFDLHHPEGWYY